METFGAAGLHHPLTADQAQQLTELASSDWPAVRPRSRLGLEGVSGRTLSRAALPRFWSASITVILVLLELIMPPRFVSAAALYVLRPAYACFS